MKKKLLTITLAVVMFIGIVACNQSIPENWQNDGEPGNPYETYETRDFVIPDTTPAMTTQAPEPEPIELINEEAEELFNIIIANKHIWMTPDTTAASLIDLDFDGIPEFIAYNVLRDTYPNPVEIVIYRFDNDTLTEFATLMSNVHTGVETAYRHISLYTDDFGNKSWALPYEIEHGDMKEFRFGLFDFTDGTVTEFVKFSATYPADSNYWGDYTGFYIDEKELFLTAEETRASQEAYARYEKELEWYERDSDDYMENSAKEFLTYGLDTEGYIWFPSGYNPSNEEYFSYDDTFPPDFVFYRLQPKWYGLKRRFEVDLIPTSYKLNATEYYVTEPRYRHFTFSVSSEGEINNMLTTLVNAYVTNDTDYFIDPAAYSLGARAKPVIYLYPEEVTDINVKMLFPNGYFTCTYPDYGDDFGNGWTVTAYPDGTLINHADGHEYSYLYWEGEGDTEWDFSEGFVVRGKDTAKFLQEKLSYLGMIPREYNEFIVYWLPLMQNNEYNLITFQTDLYENSALMFVTPTPDSMLRVFMAYKPLDNYIDIPEQELEPFERHGFAVIEWGGTEVN
ncbi:MAG: hypothetical protein FWD34_08805 [Oscillospiraceae bacterium]|nr:hypothetical protein [Oscillospiraceae bacterium]